MEIKPAMVAIAAFVVITVIAAVLMPVLQDATDTEDTFSNVTGSQGFMIPIGPDTESYTMTFDTNSPGKVVVNGEDVPLYDGTILASTDVGLIRCTNNAGTTLGFVSNNGTDNSITALSMTITNGVVSLTMDGTSQSLDISNGGFALAKTGDYVMTGAGQNIYLKSDTTIYANGLTNVTGAVWNTNIQIIGDIADGVDIDVNYPTTHTYDYSDVTINESSVSGYVDLHKFTSVTFKVMVDSDSSKVTNCTYNRLIVPAEVTAEKSIHLTDNENILLMTIPVLLILAIIIGVLAVAMRGRE